MSCLVGGAQDLGADVRAATRELTSEKASTPSGVRARRLALIAFVKFARVPRWWSMAGQHREQALAFQHVVASIARVRREVARSGVLGGLRLRAAHRARALAIIKNAQRRGSSLARHAHKMVAPELARAQLLFAKASSAFVPAAQLIFRPPPPEVKTVLRPCRGVSMTIVDVAPLFTEQTIDVTYELTNGSCAALSGEVNGSFGGEPMQPADQPVPSLAPGASITGHLFRGPTSSVGNARVAVFFGKIVFEQHCQVRTKPPTCSPFLARKSRDAEAERTVTITQLPTNLVIRTDQANPPGSTGESRCGGEYPFSSPNEWASNSGDENAAVSGTAIDSNISGGDKPPNLRFQGDVAATHPFGTDPGVVPSGLDSGLGKGVDPPLLDYELYIAPDSQYHGLLAGGNIESYTHRNDEHLPASADGEYAKASREIQAPVIGLETDQQLMPPSYAPTLDPRHLQAADVPEAPPERVAIFGSWITDCGHPDFHAEIHPPLLVARADPTGTAPFTGTTSTLIGRPYRVLQRDRADFNNLSGFFLDHVVKELTRAVIQDVAFPPGLCRITPGCKPYNVQFRAAVDKPVHGKSSFTYIVAPPTVKPNAKAQLVLEYHFVVRPGVMVAAIPEANDSGRVNVKVDMTEAEYTPAPLEEPRKDPEESPCRSTLNAKLTGAGTFLKALDDLLAKIFPGTDGGTLFAILARGLGISCYNPIVMTNKPPDPSTLPKDQQVLRDGSSGNPWPVYGFLTVRWARGS
jgi:hypothetical protein